MSGFDCSCNDELGLNDFIHHDALKYQQKGMGVTYLFYKGDKIVGYVTLAMSSIRTRWTTLKIVGYPGDSYPALELGRLAVDNSERRKGMVEC